MSEKQIPLDIRNLVIRDRQEGGTIQHIADKYSISSKAVRRVWKIYESNGTVANYSGQSRKRTISSRDDIRKKKVQMVKQNLKLSSRNIVESMNLTVSNRTVHRRLKESGLKSGFAALSLYQ